MKNRLRKISTAILLPILAGVCLTLACAPFSIGPLGLVSAGLILWVWLGSTPRQAFWQGFAYGIGLFGTGVSWVYISMHTFGDLPPVASAALTACFVAFLSLFPAVQGWTLARFFPRTNNSKVLCAFPALWVFTEWVRSWLFSGFPWLFIGYSQTASPLGGYAPLLSVYGVSLATVLAAALIVNLILLRRGQSVPTKWQPYINPTSLRIFIVALWLLGAAFNHIPWTSPDGQPIQFSLVQANIPQQLKWLPEQVAPTLNQYRELSKEHWDSEVVIWPEAAIPAELNDVLPFLMQMTTLAKKHHATFITGIPVKNPKDEHYYNGVISMGEGGQGIYLKRRLVPFGEYMPLGGIGLKVMDFLNIPMSDLIPYYGPYKPLALAHNLFLLPFICYEIAFPEQVSEKSKLAGILLTVTNDAWFGHSIAQAQHLQMAQMRALENGRPVVFASNNGITAIISAKGKLLASAPPFVTYVLTQKVQAYSGETPWQAVPMDPILILLITLFVIAFKHRNLKIKI